MHLGKYFVLKMLSEGNANMGLSRETLSSVVHLELFGDEVILLHE